MEDWPLGMKRLEYGWIYLNKIFGYIGFNYLMFFLSFCYCMVFYLFIKNILDKRLYTISILFLLLSPGIFIIHQSLLRQTLALLLFLISILMVEKKIPLIYSCLVLVAAFFFHTSSILLLPLLFTQFIRLKMSHFYLIVILYILLFFVSYSNAFSSVLSSFIWVTFPKYAVYLKSEMANRVTLNTGLGLVFSSFNFFIILYFKDQFLKKDSLKIMFFSIILLYLLRPLTLIYGEFFRLHLYFEVFFIIFIPLVYSFIDNRKLKYIYLCMNIIFSVYTLTSFFKNDKDGQKFNTYKTIFK